MKKRRLKELRTRNALLALRIYHLLFRLTRPWGWRLYGWWYERVVRATATPGRRKKVKLKDA